MVDANHRIRGVWDAAPERGVVHGECAVNANHRVWLQCAMNPCHYIDLATSPLPFRPHDKRGCVACVPPVCLGGEVVPACCPCVLGGKLCECSEGVNPPASGAAKPSVSALPLAGPTGDGGVGEVPPSLSVGTLSGGAVTSELVVPVSTGTPVELVPPGRATTSVGVGVSKALLHQHPHTVGTVVAAGESPAAGKYKGRVGALCAVAPSCVQGIVPCVGPTDGRGVGEVPPPLSVGTLSGGAVTSELVVPVSTGTPVELVPPGRATTSVGVGVSKALLHQHPHTVGTVVAAGESPAAGEYGGGGEDYRERSHLRQMQMRFHKSKFIRLESSTTLYERGDILANANTVELKALPRL